MNEMVFDLSIQEERICLLCQYDPQLAKLVEMVGPISVPKRDRPFEFLVKMLVSQQLSIKAAGTICRRVEENCGGFSQDAILFASEDKLRNAGVSRPKIRYIKELAEHVTQQKLDFTLLHTYSDEEALDILTKVRGIGRWTAEMFLIFALGRSDILALGDAGLRRAARWLYSSAGIQGDTTLEKLGELWKPYRSIASLYLWEAINQGYVDSKKIV